MRRRTVGTAAFTLIELLVVIAIIAILAAILFPVFSRAREKARQSTCLSNVRQINLGLQQYTQDYDERFPVDLPEADQTYWQGYPCQPTGSGTPILPFLTLVERAAISSTAPSASRPGRLNLTAATSSCSIAPV
jgi:prepilin-type N-terminal cleavage/methylation domain-containing protein